MAKKTYELQMFHQPDWHPSLNPLLGQIKGQYGVVTETGSIKLQLHTSSPSNVELKKGDYISSERGPTRILSAESSLGLF